uniref:Uncharacterized protein n=1 Tax=Arundo donax TaxID=35708 RepID=A0A0A8YUS2_ARUDO
MKICLARFMLFFLVPTIKKLFP